MADVDLVELALAEPAAAQRRARLELDRDHTDEGARARTRWALGLALRELGQVSAARDELIEAVRVFDRLGDARAAAMVRSSLAVALLRSGDSDGALREAEAAGPHLDGRDAALNEVQRGLILQRLGHQSEALAAYDQALPGLQAAGDRRSEARLVGNRGVLLTYAGELDRARVDLERALELARETEQPLVEAGTLQNLGFLAGRMGDLPQALSHLDQAEDRLRSLEVGPAVLAAVDIDRSEVLADAGLIDEAVARARRAVDAALAGGDHATAGEAELLLARMLVLAEQPHEAVEVAGRAQERFTVEGRDGWCLQARHVGFAARVATGEQLPVSRIEVMANELEAGGWSAEARGMRLVAARQALASGQLDAARRLLAKLTDDGGALPALAQAQRWYATALLRAAVDDRAGARRAITSGLRVLHRYRLTFGSAEMRAHAVAHTTGLVELAFDLAIEDGRPADALVALDAARATERNPSGRPAGRELIEALAVLRRIDEEERAAAREGDAADAFTLERVRAERRVRDLSRVTISASEEDRDWRLRLPELRRSLGGRTLGAYAQRGGRLHLLTATRDATRHEVLAAADEVRSELRYLQAALRRLARGASGPAADAADASVAASVVRLRELLGCDRLGEDAVIVPSAVLDGLPWSCLTLDHAQAFTIAPSARTWLAAQDRTGGSSDRVVLVAGPGLRAAETEVRTLAELYPDALVLTGRAATTSAVRDAAAGAGMLHIAAHGTFRTDNPLFSALHLADGLLTVYELDGLERPPHRVVLSSCHVGSERSVSGDAALGFGSVLLRLGVVGVVAPVVEVPDAATAAFMAELHRRLPGAAVGPALAAAAAAAPDSSPRERAARAAFVAMGS